MPETAVPAAAAISAGHPMPDIIPEQGQPEPTVLRVTATAIILPATNTTKGTAIAHPVGTVRIQEAAADQEEAEKARGSLLLCWL